MVLPNEYQIWLTDADKLNPWNFFSNNRLYHIYNDFHLIPKTRPLINPPTPKTNYVDIPGGNGSLDFTEALNGYPVFSNRTGSWEFYVDNQRRDDWEYWYAKLLRCVHGKRFGVELWSYGSGATDSARGDNIIFVGRLSVNSWKSDKDWSTVVIDYDLEPYGMSQRYGRRYSEMPTWTIDDVNEKATFDASSLCIMPYSTVNARQYYNQPVCPWFCPCTYQNSAELTNDMYFTIHFTNSDLGIDYTSSPYFVKDTVMPPSGSKASVKENWFQDPNVIIYNKDYTSTTNMTLEFIFEPADGVSWSDVKYKSKQVFFEWMPGRL